MNADIWKQTVYAKESPPYPCPHCGRGILVIEKGSLVRHATEESLRIQPARGWQPELAEYAFTCWLKCSAPRCGGLVAIVGKGYEEPEWDEEDGGTIWVEAFTPLFAWPMPPAFAIPEGCPATVASQLKASFSALWNDGASAASRLRVAVEQLLDEVGIPRRQKTPKGTFARLKLHARIEVLAKTQPESGEHLMALKWLGNTGSHEAAVTREDMLKAYEVMEHALDALLKLRAKRAAALAKDLMKRHSKRTRPRSKKAARKKKTP